MGGKAFGTMGDPIRLPTARIEPIARAICAGVGARMVLWPTQKADHGDIDLVIAASIVGSLGDEELARRTADAAGYDHVYKRPDVRDPIMFVGLKVPEGLLQVDLVSSPDELLDFAVRYLSWGDTGTMIGRMAREMGMTFGQNGLRFPVRLEGLGKDSILLTSDFDEAVRLLGWDPAVHTAGFADDREIADFIASGRYFDPKVYDASRASSEARRRGRVRRGRDEFLADVTSREGRFEWPEAKGPNPLQERFAQAALDHFGKREEVDAAIERLKASNKRAPTNFSPEAVMAATGCLRSDVGPLTSVIMEDFPGTNQFPEWKATCTVEDVQERARRAVPILVERRRIQAEKKAKHLADEERGRARRETAVTTDTKEI